MTYPVERLIQFVFELGEQAIKAREHGLRVDAKSDGSWVTDADLFIEEQVRDLVTVEFPSDGFFGEETGEVVGESARTWIVDPIDGTQQYLRGQDFWGILVAGVVSGTPDFGIVCHPARGELIWAQQGAGCFARCGGSDTRLQVSAVTRLEDAYVLHNGIASAEHAGFGAGLRSVALVANAERGYADSFGHTEVIRGRSDVMIDCLAEPQDIAAVAVCAREAGGLTAGVDSDWSVRRPAGVTVTSNGLLLGETVERLLNPRIE